MSNAVRRFEPGLRRQSAERTSGRHNEKRGKRTAREGVKNGRVRTVDEFERIKLSNKCEFSLEGVCHSSQAGIGLDVGGHVGDYFLDVS